MNQLLLSGKIIRGHPSGTAQDVQDTMAFSALHGIRPMVETVPLDQADEAYQKMMSGAARFRPRGTGYDPGRIATDLAVMLADGGDVIADLAVLRDQTGVFGPVASTPTAGGCSPTPTTGH
jgi:hypothetical protein